METTKIEFNILTSLEKQIAKLQSLLESQKITVMESASNDFSAEIEQLKNTINTAFNKAKLTPTEFGFIVKSPDFKNFNWWSITDIREKINKTSNIKNFCNANVIHWYKSSNGPKEVKITLTKGFIQSINPEYKQILSSIEIR